MSDMMIRTSSHSWLEALASAYKTKTSVILVDDAGLGVDPVTQSLLDMGKRANLSHRDWIAVVVALGVGSLGAWLVVLAVLDPEPYTKVSFAIGAGTLLTVGGGFSAIRVLTGYKPPKVTLSPRGFEISFD